MLLRLYSEPPAAHNTNKLRVLQVDSLFFLKAHVRLMTFASRRRPVPAPVSGDHVHGDDEELLASVPHHKYFVHADIGTIEVQTGGDAAAVALPFDSIPSQAQPLAAAAKKRRKKRRRPTLYDLYYLQSESSDDSDGFAAVDDNDVDAIMATLDEAATFQSSASTIAGRTALTSAASVTSIGSNATNGPTFDVQPFEIGMDINILINQVHQNVLRSLCIDDFEEQTNLFGDSELICLAASLRHNSSLVSLQLRYLPVTDVSMVPLCKALESHPTLRALDFSGTKGTRKTSEALRALTCTNTHLLHVLLTDCVMMERDKDIIEQALQYNAMVCADPRSNPYEGKMISKISRMEREQRLLESQLSYNPWVQGPPPTSMLSAAPSLPPTDSMASRDANKKKKGVSFRDDKGGADAHGDEDMAHMHVCGDYMKGSCRYGSRCKYYHPPRTTALVNAIALEQYRDEERRRAWESMSTTSSVAGSMASRPHGSSTASTAGSSWSRTEVCSLEAASASRSIAAPSLGKGVRREARFTLDARKVAPPPASGDMNATLTSHVSQRDAVDPLRSRSPRRQENHSERNMDRRRAAWRLAASVLLACCSAIAAAAALSSPKPKAGKP